VKQTLVNVLMFYIFKMFYSFQSFTAREDMEGGKQPKAFKNP